MLVLLLLFVLKMKQMIPTMRWGEMVDWVGVGMVEFSEELRLIAILFFIMGTIAVVLYFDQICGTISVTWQYVRTIARIVSSLANLVRAVFVLLYRIVCFVASCVEVLCMVVYHIVRIVCCWSIPSRRMCSICHDSLWRKLFVSTIKPCGHSFCTSCIHRWMDSKCMDEEAPACPNCNQIIVGV